MEQNVVMGWSNSNLPNKALTRCGPLFCFYVTFYVGDSVHNVGRFQTRFLLAMNAKI